MGLGVDFLAGLLAGLLGGGGLLTVLVRSLIERAVERKFREWEVRFSKLHERRVEVMEGIMERLVALKRALDAASGMQPLDDPKSLKPLGEANEALREADLYVAGRRYYLPPSVGKRAEAFLKEAKGALADLITGIHTDRTPGGRDVAFAIKHEGYKAVREKLPSLIAEVEAEFRRLVRGDTDD